MGELELRDIEKAFDRLDRLGTIDELLAKAQLRECCITENGLRAVWYAISTATEIESSSRTVIWQEVIAALNRRHCLTNAEAEILMQGRPISSG